MALLLVLYGCVIFLSAFLLFLVQPMVAKELLPVLGGSAAVWTTCLVFFQCMLLAGYCYAHGVVRCLRPRAQALAHIVLLTLALLLLGMHMHPDALPVTWHPIPSILLLLCTIIGLPYLALSATTPLLHSWMTRSFPSLAAPGIAQPYRIFALSNAGSLSALLAYPVLVEPYLSLHVQTALWSRGFFAFAVLCGAIAWQGRRASGLPAMREQNRGPLQHRVLIFLLPACSSMLLCAFTNHLSENIAAIPLLWILPLTVYLLSFIVAFAGSRWYPRQTMLKLLIFALALIGYLIYDVRMSLPIQISVPTFCVALFIACFFCHGELYRLRPAQEDATRFYLLLSAGSAAGSIFVGIVAPNLFAANYELICSIFFTVVLALAVTWEEGVAVRSLWAVASIAAFATGVAQVRELRQDSVVQLRSFYGALRVTETHLPPEADVTRTLYHGTIQHGDQLFGEGLRTVPTTYYAPDSGVGLALRYCCGNASRRVAIVGLGAGTVAAYGRRGDAFTFYELNPLVVRLANALFTYLRDTQATVQVVLGDARLSMTRQPPQQDDVIVLDAFSGDAIPVHLLTAQAIALYLRNLKPGGVLAFHISSQYLDLSPVLAEEAEHAGLHAYAVHSAANEPRGEFAADWVLMSNSSTFFSRSEVAPAVEPIMVKSRTRLWTDDSNSLLPELKWSLAERAH